ncbi:hypothetical protein [Flavobacterium psychrotrophum]|uniref:hypothetical protein n=1 Tax=Flavobacterium psychrotrophum TaxID=2294119 RepID=UPI0013C4B986|nr:hypothetical protein [Flavobacterium psychrotrophum]
MNKILNSVLSIFSLIAIVGCNTTENKLQLTLANEYIKYVDYSHTAEYTYKNDTIRKKQQIL